jgi:membrane associated rhomboid family serine protease
MALIPLGIFLRITLLPAAVFLGFWILLQIFLGFASLPGARGGGGTAWFAHVGGFVPGVIFGFVAKRRRRVVYNE